jgi:MFS family permease
LQNTKGYTPIQTGLAFLPLPAVLVATAMTVQNKLLKRIGPRPLMTIGLLLGAGAMAWLAQLTPTASYGTHVLPALLLLGVGIGSTSPPAMFTATSTVPPADAGVASAMVNTMQQAGGAIGASVLSTIFASAVSSYLHTHTHTPTAQLTSAAAVHGYTTAFWVAAAIFAAGAILIGTLVPSITPRPTTPKPTPAPAQPKAPRKPKAPTERTSGESHVFETATQICRTVLPRQAPPVSVASSGAVGGDLDCTDSLTSRVRPVLGVPRKLAHPKR